MHARIISRPKFAALSQYEGKFVNVTEKISVLDDTSKLLGVAVVDFDKDDWPDVVVSNDMQPNKLYKNNGGKGFTETVLSAGIAGSLQLNGTVWLSLVKHESYSS